MSPPVPSVFMDLKQNFHVIRLIGGNRQLCLSGPAHGAQIGAGKRNQTSMKKACLCRQAFEKSGNPHGGDHQTSIVQRILTGG